MHLFQLTPISVIIGIGAIILTAFIRFYYAFRYQYLCLLFRSRPTITKRILERSYLKNQSIVGLLDKSTKEILDGDFNQAEKFIIEGILKTREKKGIQNQLICMFCYSNLSWILYYKGQHKESLQVAISLYEKTMPTPGTLALITCNFARLGDISRAVETLSKLSKMKKAHSSILLPCEAEIEAAKGNSQKAVDLLDQAQKIKKKVSIHFIMTELDKRIHQIKESRGS